MQYRIFGKLDWEVSALGFGCMRLPTLDGQAMSSQIDEREAIRMIRSAIDSGVNYVDTAYPYHNGQSEVIVGKTLKNGYRVKTRLATKLPIWLVQTPDDFDRYLEEQLNRLQTDYIDFYLFHALNKPRWEQLLKLNLLEKAETAKKSGKIGHIGFSFHDSYESFSSIIDGYDRWEFCQIQYNYMDIHNQAGVKGLKYASSKNIAVVVMEPLLGGKLANPPQNVHEVVRSAETHWEPADLALQWLWDQPEIAVVLSGMNTMEQVQDNLQSASKARIGALSSADHQLISRLRSEYLSKTQIPCTHCRYCMPCPNGVNIPRVFELYNDGYIHADVKPAQRTYLHFLEEKERANACIRCRVCESKCPQSIPISQWMPKVHGVLGDDKSYEA